MSSGLRHGEPDFFAHSAQRSQASSREAEAAGMFFFKPERALHKLPLLRGEGGAYLSVRLRRVVVAACELGRKLSFVPKIQNSPYFPHRLSGSKS